MPPQKKFKISEVILGSLPGFLVGKTVGKLLKISVSQFLTCKMGIITHLPLELYKIRRK